MRFLLWEASAYVHVRLICFVIKMCIGVHSWTLVCFCARSA